jgi:hypothetical protein
MGWEGEQHVMQSRSIRRPEADHEARLLASDEPFTLCKVFMEFSDEPSCLMQGNEVVASRSNRSRVPFTRPCSAIPKTLRISTVESPRFH